MPEAGATSSPKPSATQAADNKSLRILVINFQSARKKGKNIDVLVQSAHPDISLDTKTWLSPNSYTLYIDMLDRHNDPHGGVLNAVKKDLEMTNIQKGKEVELITGTVNISKTLLLRSITR